MSTETLDVTCAVNTDVSVGLRLTALSVFASWDAEEYALVGSTEWVEDHASWLRDTAISYLNLDIAVSGPLPGAGSTPELRTLAQDIMKKIVYGTHTLYDAWYDLYRFMPEDNGFTNLGSGSDYTAFVQLGVGALDFGFDADRNTPVYHYHSNYDSYHWMKTLIDPDFSIHAAAGQFVTLLAYHLADDPLIPFDIETYARNVNYYVRDLVQETHNWGGEDVNNVQLQTAIEELVAAARKFQQVANHFSEVTAQQEFLGDATKVRGANDRMKQLGRLFVRPQGLPGRPFYKNGLWAPNRWDGYKALDLPGSVEALQDGDLPRCKDWNVWLINAIDQASKLLTLEYD